MIKGKKRRTRGHICKGKSRHIEVVSLFPVCSTVQVTLFKRKIWGLANLYGMYLFLFILFFFLISLS